MKYLLLFVFSLMISLVLTPVVRRWAIKRGILERPDPRKIQRKERIPYLGGIAVFWAFFGGLALAAVSNRSFWVVENYRFLGIVFGGTIIAVLGVYDDWHGATPKMKLLFQFLAAVEVMFFGFIIDKVTSPLGGILYLGWWGIPVTIFWIIGLTNAINLLDGLDGLASGVVSIVSLTLFVAAVKSNGDPYLPVLTICLIGALLGFLRYNFYPAKIFLGDTGSLFLGFILAVITIEGWHKGTATISLMVPLIAMALPLLDTSLAIIRRLLSHRKIFSPDKSHVHHRLMLLVPEQNQRVVVVQLYFLTICYGMIALAFADPKMNGIYAVIALVVVSLVTLNWINKLRMFK